MLLLTLVHGGGMFIGYAGTEYGWQYCLQVSRRRRVLMDGTRSLSLSGVAQSTAYIHAGFCFTRTLKTISLYSIIAILLLCSGAPWKP